MTLIVRLSNVFSTDNPFQALPSTPTPADRKSKLVKSDRQTRSQPSSRRTGGSLLNLHRQAQSWSGLSDSQSSRHRKATKAALSLAQLILDPPDADIRPPAATHRTSPKAEGRRGSGGSSVGNSLSTSTRKTTVPRLREKDVARLRTQLLKPESAGLVIAQARRLNKDQIQHDQLYQQNGHIAPNGVEPTRAVCLDCDESKAEDLIRHAAKTQKARVQQEIQLGQHKYSTLKTMPPAPARLPVLLSLLEPLKPAKSDAKRDSDVHLGKLEDALISLRMEEADSEDSSQGPMLPFGLMLPPSAMSLHRPLAGALPTADTLRRGFDALLNAESKVYMYEGPSHKGMHPPTDRLSIYTYWWGFELVMPPPTIVYLSHVKEISTSLLNLLGVIVYAVPGGTRELAPFVGVMSRFIETEWNMLKAQDHGKGVVCAATWFIPAALVARPWDFDDGDRDSSLRIAHKKIK